MILTSSNDSIRLTASVSGDLEVYVAYIDKTGSSPPYSYTGGRTTPTSITGTSATTLVSGVSSTERAIRLISISNNHASANPTVTIEFSDGTNLALLKQTTLAPGETLVMDAAFSWTKYGTNGGAYIAAGPIASNAEMEAATSNSLVVSPGRLHRHPAAAKCWIRASPGGIIDASYNITSSADPTGGVCDITIGTDFSTANYAVCAISTRTNTNTTVTDAKNTAIRSGTLAAGAFSIETIDQTATNFVVEDPANWHAVAFGDQ